MKYILPILILLFLSPCSYAEQYSFTIPTKNMILNFDSPELSSFEGKSNKDQMQFKAQGFEGFNLSYFIEPATDKGKNDKECFDFYWSKATGNPMMDKNSIKTRQSKNMYIAEYDLAGEWKGQKFRMPNRNYYMYINGNCIDIHVSKLPYNDSDLKIFTVFEQSISFTNSN